MSQPRHFTYTAVGPVTGRRFVKFSTTTNIGDTYVAQSSAAADLIIGVSAPNITVNDGDRVDVQHSGPGEVEAGAAITRGQMLTSDANGRAIPVPAASTVRSGAMALASAAAGDFFPVFINLVQVTTP